MPPKVQKQYLDLVLKHHMVVSEHRFNLGRTNKHSIELKDKTRVYVTQFQIPDAHREEVERHVNEWLKIGVIKPLTATTTAQSSQSRKRTGTYDWFKASKHSTATATSTSTP